MRFIVEQQSYPPRLKGPMQMIIFDALILQMKRTRLWKRTSSIFLGSEGFPMSLL